MSIPLAIFKCCDEDLMTLTPSIDISLFAAPERLDGFCKQWRTQRGLQGSDDSPLNVHTQTPRFLFNRPVFPELYSRLGNSATTVPKSELLGIVVAELLQAGCRTNSVKPLKCGT